MKKKYRIVVAIIIFLIFGVLVNNIKSSQIDSKNHRMQWSLDLLFKKMDLSKIVGEREVKVAIIDSGIDREHLSIKKSVIEQILVSDIDKKNNNNYEHGTAVCGIISGSLVSNDGVIGINSKVKIIDIDVSDNTGIINKNSLVEAIKCAIDKKVDIINISICTNTNYEEIHTVIKEAFSKGIIIIASAGNDIDDKYAYPAAYKEVISVGAYSKNGKILYSKLKNTVYLPGKNIVTTRYDFLNKNKYGSETGTSLASPILTGIVSLILSHDNISNKEIIKYFNQYRDDKITNVKKIFEDFDIKY